MTTPAILEQVLSAPRSEQFAVLRALQKEFEPALVIGQKVFTPDEMAEFYRRMDTLDDSEDMKDYIDRL